MPTTTALVTLATVLALVVPLRSTGQSVADLLKAFIQDEESAKMLQEVVVQSIDASAQRFSLNIAGCNSINSTVRDRLSDFLEGVFPDQGITISCAAGKSHYQLHVNFTESWAYERDSEVLYNFIDLLYGFLIQVSILEE